jgi:Cu2+-containing amine oxidase
MVHQSMAARSRVYLVLVLVTFCPVKLSAQMSFQQKSLQATIQASQEVLPLNPLSVEEKRSAENIAVADSKVMKLLGTGRRQLVSVELFPIKPDAERMAAAAAGLPIPLERYAEVVFLRYENEAGVRAIVDLSRRNVIDVTQISADQVPLTDNDLAEASRLALSSPEVKAALGPEAQRFRPPEPETSARSNREAKAEQYIIRGLPLRTQDENDSCWKHRCLQLLFRRGDVYLTRPVVVVDLTAHQVRLEQARKERDGHEQSH